MSQMETSKKTQTEHWEQTQIKAFSSWANYYLHKRGLSLQNICEDFKDGVLLINLLEILFNDTAGKYYNPPKSRTFRIENANIALNFMKKHRIPNRGCAAEDIVDGKVTMILGMTWTIAREAQMDAGGLLNMVRRSSTVGNEKQDQTVTKEKDRDEAIKRVLLNFIKARTGYDLKEFGVENWTDGKVLAALVSSFADQVQDLKAPNVDKLSSGDRIEVAIETAEKILGIPKLFEAEDLELGQLDPKSLMLYTSLFVNHERQKATEEELRKQAVLLQAQNTKTQQLLDDERRKAEEAKKGQEERQQQMEEEKRRREEAEKQAERLRLRQQQLSEEENRRREEVAKQAERIKQEKWLEEEKRRRDEAEKQAERLRLRQQQLLEEENRRREEAEKQAERIRQQQWLEQERKRKENEAREAERIRQQQLLEEAARQERVRQQQIIAEKQRREEEAMMLEEERMRQEVVEQEIARLFQREKLLVEEREKEALQKKMEDLRFQEEQEEEERRQMLWEGLEEERKREATQQRMREDEAFARQLVEEERQKMENRAQEILRKNEEQMSQSASRENPFDIGEEDDDDEEDSPSLHFPNPPEMGGHYEGAAYVVSSNSNLHYNPASSSSSLTSTHGRRKTGIIGLANRVAKECGHKLDKAYAFVSDNDTSFSLFRKYFRFQHYEPLYGEFPCKFASSNEHMMIGAMYVTPNYLCFTGTLLQDRVSVILSYADIKEIEEGITTLLERYKVIPTIIPISSTRGKPNALLIRDTQGKVHRLFSFNDTLKAWQTLYGVWDSNHLRLRKQKIQSTTKVPVMSHSFTAPTPPPPLPKKVYQTQNTTVYSTPGFYYRTPDTVVPPPYVSSQQYGYSLSQTAPPPPVQPYYYSPQQRPY